MLTVSEPEDVEAAIIEVERRAIERWLPASFQVGTFSQPDNLDEILTERGYLTIGPTTVQAMSAGDLQGFIEKANPDVEKTAEPEQEWLDFFWGLEGYTDPTTQIVSRQILTSVESVFYQLRSEETGRIICIAKMSLIENYGGLYCLYTDPEHR